MTWQKPARIGVAIIGLASAAAVYLLMGERHTAPASQPIHLSEPKAVAEFSNSFVKDFAPVNKDFEVTQGKGGKTTVYEDGRRKITGDPLTIVVPKGEHRTITITTREATISKDENFFQLTGPVKLEDSDGFWLTTDAATVNKADSIAHVPGPAMFGKGRMSGSGTGMSYDEMRQILLISHQVRVKTVDAAQKQVMELISETGMLDRQQHVLTLDTGVHVVREMQVIDTEHANGRLNMNNDVVTFMELHGSSRVAGGASIDAMSARDISLDYTDDGKTLEAVKMAGSASVTMKGEAGRSGRGIVGETVDLSLAPDGALTNVTGRDNVRLDLPAGADTPQRTIASQALDGTGQSGEGLTSATFTKDVSFTEQVLPAKEAAADKQAGQRTAHAQKLETTLADDAVIAATFSGGDVTFEETGLKACAAQAEYQPQKGSLKLSGASKAGAPMVAEENVAIEGESIDVALETRRMTADGKVTTWMRSPAIRRCRPSAPRAAGDQGASHVPSLLAADMPVTIHAPHLEYDSRKGYADYSGGKVTLDQGETAISGARIVIDQTKGDLTVTGRAVTTLMLDQKLTTGQANEIRYSDEQRLIVYAGAAKTADTEASLNSGSDSRLRAGRIDVKLAAKENTLEWMKARGNVRVTEGSHTVQGGATLDYTASDGKYVVKAEGAMPVVVITREGDVCRQQSGTLIVFYKGKETLEIDGLDRRQANSTPSKSACSPSTR